MSSFTLVILINKYNKLLYIFIYLTRAKEIILILLNKYN